VRALVLSDTHLSTGALDRLPDEVWQMAGEADLVLHAGDVVDHGLLAALAEHAPVHAVLGNNDHALVGRLPERLVLDLAGVPVAIVHDSGPSAGRAGRLRAWFPSAGVVVFGHSHDPLVEEHAGLLLVNPGSPTQRRRQPVHTVAWLEAVDGEARAELVPVGPLAVRSTAS
jgi:putative phosphoesterase